MATTMIKMPMYLETGLAFERLIRKLSGKAITNIIQQAVNDARSPLV